MESSLENKDSLNLVLFPVETKTCSDLQLLFIYHKGNTWTICLFVHVKTHGVSLVQEEEVPVQTLGMHRQHMLCLLLDDLGVIRG